MALRLSRGQQAFLDAVRAGESGTFHKSVVIMVVDLDMVWWAKGDFMPACDAYDAADFVPKGGQR